MTKAQAVSVVGDLVNAGYNVNATQNSNATWTVVASSKDGPVSVASIATFAANHGVIAVDSQAVFN